jgi:hypothetical protein
MEGLNLLCLSGGLISLKTRLAFLTVASIGGRGGLAVIYSMRALFTTFGSELYPVRPSVRCVTSATR